MRADAIPAALIGNQRLDQCLAATHRRLVGTLVELGGDDVVPGAHDVAAIDRDRYRRRVGEHRAYAVSGGQIQLGMMGTKSLPSAPGRYQMTQSGGRRSGSSVMRSSMRRSRSSHRKASLTCDGRFYGCGCSRPADTVAAMRAVARDDRKGDELACKLPLYRRPQPNIA